MPCRPTRTAWPCTTAWVVPRSSDRVGGRPRGRARLSWPGPPTTQETEITSEETETPTPDPDHGHRPPDREPRPGPRSVVARFAGDQRVAFLGVGAINTALGTAFFVGLQLTLGRVAHYLVVLLCAHVLSVLCAFVMHRRMVFRVRGNVLLDLARFETVYLGALGVNLVLLPLLVEVGGLPVILSQLLIVGVTSLMSFFGHKHFSFRRSGTAG